MSWIDWLIVVTIPLATLFVGRNQPKPTKWVDYFLARRRLSSSLTVSTYIGSNLAFTAIFMVLTLEASQRGWWVFSVPLAWICGTVLLIKLYPKMRPFLERGETLHQALGSMYDDGQTGWKTIRRWASLWTIIAFVGTVALEFYGGVRLLEWAKVPQVQNYVFAIFLACICATFTIRGGLRGVAKVDVWLDIASAIGILILFCYIAYNYFSQSVVFSSPKSSALQSLPTMTDNFVFAVASFLIFIPFQICAMDTWQRGVAWEKRDDVAVPLLIGAFCIVLASIVAVLGGSYLRSKGIVIPQNSHPLLELLSELKLPPVMIGLVIGGFIAAILSTADELLNCCGYALLSDFINLPRGNEISDEINLLYIRSGKFYTGLFAFIAAFFAYVGVLSQKQVTDFFNVVMGTQVVFILPILFGFFSVLAGRMRVAALIAMLSAFIVALLSTIAGWINGGIDGKNLIDSAPIAAFFTSLIIMLLGYVTVRLKARIKS